MIISIASGKGGTGKTTLAVNLALALGHSRRVELVDLDVEEPNDHLFLNPSLKGREEVCLPVPDIDKTRCTYCGYCADICAYGALTVIKDSVIVFEELCHGCGGCSLLCPEEAVRERPRPVGTVEWGRAGDVSFVQGRLNPGEAFAPPVTRAAKRRMSRQGLVIVDAPPGTACPAVEAVKGSDLCVLVTEPTPFGLNDLALAAEMARGMGLPAVVVINRCDLGDDGVDRFCEEEGLPVLARIPFDRALAEAYARGRTAVNELPGWQERFAEIGRALLRSVEGGARQ